MSELDQRDATRVVATETFTGSNGTTLLLRIEGEHFGQRFLLTSRQAINLTNQLCSAVASEGTESRLIGVHAHAGKLGHFVLLEFEYSDGVLVQRVVPTDLVSSLVNRLLQALRMARSNRDMQHRTMKEGNNE